MPEKDAKISAVLDAVKRLPGGVGTALKVIDKVKKTLSTPVRVPAAMPTATGANPALLHDYYRDDNMIDSTVGRELGIASAGLAAPAIIGTAPAWAPTLIPELASFEAINQTPRIFGGNSVTRYGGQGAEWLFRKAMKNDEWEESLAPYVNSAGQFITSIPLGIGSHAALNGAKSAVRGAVSDMKGISDAFSGNLIDIPASYDEQAILNAEQDLLRGMRERARMGFADAAGRYRDRLGQLRSNMNGLPTSDEAMRRGIDRIRVPYYDAEAANVGLAPNDPDFVNVFRERAMLGRERNATLRAMQRDRRRTMARIRAEERASEAAAGAPENFRRDYGVTWDRYRQILENHGEDLSVVDPRQALPNLETAALSEGRTLRDFLREGSLPGEDTYVDVISHNHPVIRPSDYDIDRIVSQPLINSTPTAPPQALTGVTPEINLLYDIQYGRSPEELAAMVRGTGRNVSSLSELSEALRDIEADVYGSSREALLAAVNRGSLQSAAPSVASTNPFVAGMRRLDSYEPSIESSVFRGMSPESLADSAAKLSDTELSEAYMARMRRYIQANETNGQYNRKYNADIETDRPFRALANEMQNRFGSELGEGSHFGKVAGTEYDKIAKFYRSPGSPYYEAGEQYLLPGDIVHQSWFKDSSGNLENLFDPSNTVLPSEAAARLYDTVPSGSALATTYPFGSTSIDSYSLPMMRAIRRGYGTNPGQASVVPFVDKNGSVIMSTRNNYGVKNTLTVDDLLKDFERAGRDKGFSSVGINFRDPIEPLDFETYIKGGGDMLAPEKTKLYKDFVGERLLDRRNAMLHKLDVFWPKVAEMEGWAADYIPKARIDYPAEKELKDMLKAFQAGSNSFQLSPPKSASYLTIKHKYGGPLLVNPYSSGGGIHIKPSHRGRLTELKKRTGKSEAELYNDGNPAHRKMVVFARNARKWKHADGGPLYNNTFLWEPEQTTIQKVAPPVPYKTPEVDENGDIVGFPNITKQIEDGAGWLYKKNVSEGTRFYRDNKSGDIFAALPDDGVTLNLSGFTEIPYSSFSSRLPKRDYIGGDDYRIKSAQRIPGLMELIDEKAKSYGVDPNLVLHRILKEGYIDQNVRYYNDEVPVAYQKDFWKELMDEPVSGFDSLGLDDAGSHIKEGKYELKDPSASWEDIDAENEKGREVHSVLAKNLPSAIEILAAEMAYRQNELRKRGFPADSLGIYTNAAFNMGLYNDRLNDDAYIRATYSYPSYYEKYGLSRAEGGNINRSISGIAKRLNDYYKGDRAAMMEAYKNARVKVFNRGGNTWEYDGGTELPMWSSGPVLNQSPVIPMRPSQSPVPSPAPYENRRNLSVSDIARMVGVSEPVVVPAVPDTSSQVESTAYRVMPMIAGQQIPVQHDTTLSESYALGKSENKAVADAIASLRSGEDLKSFQRMLLENGYYDSLPTPKITAKTKDEIKALQQMLIDAGYDLGKYGVDGIIGNYTQRAWEQYVKDNPSEALIEMVADGHLGSATRNAARKYYSQMYRDAEARDAELSALTEEEPLPAFGEKGFVPESIINTNPKLLGFPEYLYKSGQVGPFRRLGNSTAVLLNYVNGMLNPHGENAWLSEGAKRQMVGASLAHNDAHGYYGITDVEHAALGGMEGHSGTEFRKDSSKRDYMSQLADAPYHNIYGQSAITFNPDTGVFSPGPDSYTFNNVWDGNNVVEVVDDGAGESSLREAYDEYKRARESGSSIKAAMESAASRRGVNVKAKEGKANSVGVKKYDKYVKEYEEYLSNPKKRERFERRLAKNAKGKS